MKKFPGFTLLELAIALVIIGLLVGGILRWQESDAQQMPSGALASPR